MFKRYRLLLVPEDGGPVRTIHVPLRVVPFVLGAVMVAALFVVAGGFGLMEGWSQRREAARLLEENLGLRQHVQAVDARFEAVLLSLEAAEQLEAEARMLTGSQSTEAPLPRLGVGGPRLTTAPSIGYTSPGRIDAKVETQIERLEDLERRVAVQRQSYSERLARMPVALPVPGAPVISSEFGWREDPFAGGDAFHQGVDVRGTVGSPVHATADGVIQSVGDRGEYGLTVVISHADGIETMYAHLDSASCREGDRVQRGDVIGALGSSGRSTGPHVHYEVRVDGVPQDPRQFLASRDF